ncbi:MAG: helix-turn-helix domain-containing protein [Chloroflexota bacterium]
MVNAQTIDDAKAAAEELRRIGQEDAAQAVLALIDSVRTAPPPQNDLLTTTEAGNVFGVTGQTIKNWVRDERLAGYRIGGRIMLPRRAVEEYVHQAGASLDFEPLSDEEAAQVVAEGRPGWE